MSNPCRPQISKNKISARMRNYSHRTGKFSPLNQLQYMFLKGLYQYLTRQHQTSEQKEAMYTNYTAIVDKGYFPNRETPNPQMLEIMYLQMQLILENEYKGQYTFILLNNSWHYQKMGYVLNMIYTWSLSPSYYGYASEEEFWELMNFIRKQFSNNEVDLVEAVGKYPKKLRRRFGRESKSYKYKGQK